MTDSPLGHVSGQGIIPEAVSIESVRLTARIFDDPDQMYWIFDGAIKVIICVDIQ